MVRYPILPKVFRVNFVNTKILSKLFKYVSMQILIKTFHIHFKQKKRINLLFQTKVHLVKAVVVSIGVNLTLKVVFHTVKTVKIGP